MKLLLKSAFAAAILLGAAATITPQANAGGVSVGVTLGGPYISPYGPGYVAYDDDYYYDPIYISGAWYHGPYRWQMRNGERMFYVNGRWHRNEWRDRPMPSTIMFRNGGSFRDGHNVGFGDADRINARFRPGNREIRDDRQDIRSDRRDIRQDQREMRDDRQDRRDDRHEDNDNDHPRN